MDYIPVGVNVKLQGPGTVLKPGEAAVFSMPLDTLDPAFADLVQRGLVELEIKQGVAEEIAPNRYRSVVELWADGEPYRNLTIEWSVKPSLIKRLRQKVQNIFL